MKCWHKSQLLWVVSILLAVMITGCDGNDPIGPSVLSNPTTVIVPSVQPAPMEVEIVIETETQTLMPSATETKLPEIAKTPSPPVDNFAGVEINRQTDLNFVENIGSHWVRRNGLLWHRIEPQVGVRDWSFMSQVEEELIRISEAGMEVILIVRGAPDWALVTEGRQCGPIHEEAFDDYALFLQEAVRRYKDQPYNVNYWELGNEPDVDQNNIDPTGPFGCWGDASDKETFGGQYYAELLKVVYPAIKEVDPNAQVLIGGLLMDCDPIQPPEIATGQPKNCLSSRFLDGIMENGGGDYFDGVSFHAYDYYHGAEGNFSNGNWHSAWNTTGPVIAAKARYIREVLAKYGYPQKYLMNTETALLCGQDGSEPDCQTEIFNKTKASYIIQSNLMAIAEGLRANIWYSLTGWRGSGMIDAAGQPLPVYQAYQFNIKILTGMEYSGKINDFPRTFGYEFQQGERILWVIWSIDREAHDLFVPGELIAAYDSIGNELNDQEALTVTLAPLYVEWIKGK